MRATISLMGATVTVMLMLARPGPARADVIYSAAADFSLAANPNGVWSYGYLAAGVSPDPGTFTLYGNAGSRTDGIGGTDVLDFVSQLPSLDPPYVSRNPAGTTATFFTATYAPGQAGFHPGPASEYSVYRFTAPQAGTYDLGATFSGLDPNSLTTVHVLQDATSLFNDSLSGLASSSYAATLALGAGARVDFIVGSNGSYFNDSTGLAATLTLRQSASAVPEPAGLALFCLAGVLGIGLRRRQTSPPRD